MLWASIEMILGAWLVSGQEEHPCPKARHILHQNCYSGRTQRYLRNHPICGLADYIQQVLKYYQTENYYVHQLRVLQDQPAWESLLNMLFHASRCHLLGKDLPNCVVNDMAEDYVYETIPALLCGYFPYHSSFHAWSVVVLRNTINKSARSLMAGKRASQQVYLDDLPTRSLMQVLFTSGVEEQVVRRCDLREAIAQLGPRSQLIIHYYYEQGLSFEEIAAKLQTTKDAVYAQHKRIKAVLKTRLEENEQM